MAPQPRVLQPSPPKPWDQAQVSHHRSSNAGFTTSDGATSDTKAPKRRHASHTSTASLRSNGLPTPGSSQYALSSPRHQPGNPTAYAARRTTMSGDTSATPGKAVAQGTTSSSSVAAGAGEREGLTGGVSVSGGEGTSLASGTTTATSGNIEHGGAGSVSAQSPYQQSTHGAYGNGRIAGGYGSTRYGLNGGVAGGYSGGYGGSYGGGYGMGGYGGYGGGYSSMGGMYGGGYGGYGGGGYGSRYGMGMNAGGVGGMDNQYSWLHSLHHFTSSLGYLTEMLGMNTQAIGFVFGNLMGFLEHIGNSLTSIQPWREFPPGHPRYGEPPPTPEEEQRRLSRLRVLRFAVTIVLAYAGFRLSRFLHRWLSTRRGFPRLMSAHTSMEDVFRQQRRVGAQSRGRPRTEASAWNELSGGGHAPSRGTSTFDGVDPWS